MLVSDEILIIGLIDEYSIDGIIMLKEIKAICYDYLQVGNMYSTLLDMFRQKGLVKKNDNLDKVELPYKAVFEILNSPAYLSAVSQAAPFMNGRGTFANIKLIVTSLVLLNKQYLTYDDIKFGVDAYTLTVRELKCEYINLQYEKVQRAFRLINRAISKEIFKTWCERMRGFLECNKKERIAFNAELLQAEKEYERRHEVELNPHKQDVTLPTQQSLKSDKSPKKTRSSHVNFAKERDSDRKTKEKKEQITEVDDPYIFYHEFLYLLCNSQDRIAAIVDNHKVEFKSQKGVIYQWEIPNKQISKLRNSSQDIKSNHHQCKTSHIDLLADTAFKNQAPMHLVEEALNRFAEEYNFRFEGAQKDKGKRVTAESLNQMFEKRLEHLLRQKEKHGKDFDYFSQTEDPFYGDILTFCSQNYDKKKFDVEQLKQRQKLMRKMSDRELADFAMDDLASSKGNSSGLYITQKSAGVNKDSNGGYREYNPKEFQVEPGVYDFRRAPGYDEEIVRHNLNYVKRPKTAKILAPSLVKEVEVKTVPNFVKLNRDGLSEVSRINQKRVEMMKETSTTMASRMTKATTAESSIMQPASVIDPKESRHRSMGTKKRYLNCQYKHFFIDHSQWPKEYLTRQVESSRWWEFWPAEVQH